MTRKPKQPQNPPPAVAEHDALMKRLARRDQLETEIHESEKAIGELQVALDSRSRDYQVARNEMKAYRNDGGAWERYVSWPAKYQQAEDRAKELEQEMEKLQGDITMAQAGREAMQQELDALNITVSTEAVLEHQGQVDALAQQVADLEKRIASHQATIDGAGSYTGPVPELLKKREDLMAAVTLGEAEESELTKLDAEIEAAQASADGEIADREARIDQARQTVSGLRRRLKEVVSRKAELEQKSEAMLDGLLQCELAAAHAECERLTAQAGAAVARWAALETRRKQLFPIAHGLPSAIGIQPAWKGLLGAGQVAGALEELTKRFAAQGVRGI